MSQFRVKYRLLPISGDCGLSAMGMDGVKDLIWSYKKTVLIGVAVIASLSFGIVQLTKNNASEGNLESLDRANNIKNFQIDAQASSSSPGEPITFEEIIAGKFGAKSFNGTWWSESELQWRDQDNNLVKWDIHTNETTVLVSADLLASIAEGAQFQGFSPDETLLLFAYEIELIWRHSFTARYVVLNTQTDELIEVTSQDGGSRLQYCDWVENDESDNILVYVYKNNIYWRLDGSQNDSEDLVITDSGIVDNVFNGIPDWVYEEEVLGTNVAMYPSLSGAKLAYVEFNDTLVPDFRYPMYGNPADVLGAQYPEYKIVRYPKAGEVNPTIAIYIRDLTETESRLVNPPTEVTGWTEYIYTDVTWVSDELVSITWMNRIQNESIVSHCVQQEVAQGKKIPSALRNWDCYSVQFWKQSNGWIEIAPSPIYNGDGSQFISILPAKQDGDQGRHYKHVTLTDTASGSTTPLTQGAMVVTEILAWDESEDSIYFMATDEHKPGSRQMYMYNTTEKTQTCLTCSLLTTRGETCSYSSIYMSPDFLHYVQICLGEGLPEVVLRRLSDGNAIFELETNSLLEDLLENKTLPTIVHTTVAVDGGHEAPVRMALPPNMVPGEVYPMLVYVYGGPGSQMVSYRFSVGWGDYLATSRGVIYASIDGRGTGFQSDEYLYSVYRNLGTVEMQDQIAVTRKLVADNSFVDKDRVAIWGWSYGGFATVMTLEQDVGPDPVFSCGISVAPVTSWLLYDSVYTERYMAHPMDNVEGYNNSAIVGIENLRNKHWMLNHGVADDNVHYQHSMLLVRALERADIHFLQNSYPDENHGLRGVSRYLYHAMDDFWSSCFQLPPPEASVKGQSINQG